MSGYDECLENYYALVVAIKTGDSVDAALIKMGLKTSDQITSHAHLKKTERDKEVVELSKTISKNTEIARITGVSPARVCVILNRNGIYRRGRGYDKRRKGVLT